MLKTKHIMRPVKSRTNPDAISAGIGTRMSQAIERTTGKKPCGFCRAVRDMIDKLESKLKGTP